VLVPQVSVDAERPLTRIDHQLLHNSSGRHCHDRHVNSMVVYSPEQPQTLLLYGPACGKHYAALASMPEAAAEFWFARSWPVARPDRTDRGERAPPVQ
jgi:hypothetical protein